MDHLHPYENVGMDHLLSMEKEIYEQKNGATNINVLLSFERVFSFNKFFENWIM